MNINYLFSFGDVFEHVLDRPERYVTEVRVAPIASDTRRPSHILGMIVRRCAVVPTAERLAAVSESAWLILKVDMYVRQL